MSLTQYLGVFQLFNVFFTTGSIAERACYLALNVSCIVVSETVSIFRNEPSSLKVI